MKLDILNLSGSDVAFAFVPIQAQRQTHSLYKKIEMHTPTTNNTQPRQCNNYQNFNLDIPKMLFFSLQARQGWSWPIHCYNETIRRFQVRVLRVRRLLGQLRGTVSANLSKGSFTRYDRDCDWQKEVRNFASQTKLSMSLTKLNRIRTEATWFYPLNKKMELNFICKWK